jgi:hypothetical protein
MTLVEIERLRDKADLGGNEIVSGFDLHLTLFWASSGATTKSQGVVVGCWVATRAIKSSTLDRNSFRIGDVLAFLCSTTRSIFLGTPVQMRHSQRHAYFQ